MAFVHTMNRLRQENVLYSVLFELTYRCNLDCFFCYNDLSLQGTSLELDHYYVALEDLAEMQVMQVALSGGEPLAHPDFLRIGARARELGFMVRVKSNGHALRGELAKRVKEEVDPYQIDISLHGAKAETHDRQTRIPGSFDRLMDNLQEIRELGLRVQLKSTLTSWNEEQTADMMDLAQSFGVKIEFDTSVTPRDDGDLSPLSIAPTRAGVERLLGLLKARSEMASASSRDELAAPSEVQKSQKATPKLNCGSGNMTLTVDPFGNVYPCVQWRRSLGNLHEQRIREIWQSSPALRDVRRINGEAYEMMKGLGDKAPQAGFCMGLAAQQTGDPLSLYPSVKERLRSLGVEDPESTESPEDDDRVLLRVVP